MSGAQVLDPGYCEALRAVGSRDSVHGVTIASVSPIRFATTVATSVAKRSY